MLLLSYLCLFCFFKNSMSKGYFRTEEKRVNDWNKHIIRHIPGIYSKIVCAGLCQVEQKCNSFKLNDNNCTLAGPINKLEEFSEDLNNPKHYEAFYLEDMGKPYPKKCWGGDNCCNSDNTCSWYWRDGDCDTDNDCHGIGTVCGTNNCLIGFNSRNNSMSIRAVDGFKGLWDETDDCCTKRCTPENPCQPGDGECELDQDCVEPEFNTCHDTCKQDTIFPLQEFPNNYIPRHYDDNLSRCCRRRCINNDGACGLNEKGCKYEEDCNEGLKCSEDFICVDINECDEDRPGTIACGENANCINTIGSFECECHDGYDNFIYGYGCSSGTNFCKNGMKNNDVCCGQECETCGGPTCNSGHGYSGPDGVINCCVGRIRQSSKICTTDEDVACVIPKVECPTTGNWSITIQDHCYSHHKNLTKLDAIAHCNNIGGKIFEPRDETTYILLHSYFTKIESDLIWLGITKQEIPNNGTMEWSWTYDSDNTLISFTNWKRYEPAPEDWLNCIEMDFKAEVEMSWKNLNCDNSAKVLDVICEAN